MSSRHIRRDDFDIESIETFHDRDICKSRSSGSRNRSRSRKRSYSRRLDNGSRSRSRSIERKSCHLRRDPSSHSRIRSHSRGHSRRSDRYYQTSRRYRDSRSKSFSKSRTRSRSQSYSPRHQNNRHRKNYKERNRRSSRSRSRSRSSSHFRDFGSKSTKSQIHSSRKSSTSTSSSLASVKNENNNINDPAQNLEDLPLPQQKEMYYFNENEPIDRARIHREMEEKLRATLAKDGKIYPPPKPEASHPVFANDGSFLEIFKKMQQAQSSTSKSAAADSKVTKFLPIISPIVPSANLTTAPYLAAVAGKNAPPRSIVTRRRGSKILKTGVVAKPKITADANADPKDFWSLYLAEVNKYKNTACESEQGNRPLVK